MADFLKFLAAIPVAISTIGEMIKFLKQTFGDDWSKYLADVGPVFKELNTAKTSDDKYKAAQNLAQLAERWGKIQKREE